MGLKEQAKNIFLSAVGAVDPYALIKKKVILEDGVLKIEKGRYSLSEFGSIYVVGGGKAFAPMAKALEEVLQGKIKEGVGVTKYDHILPLKSVKLLEGGHPIPDKGSFNGAKAILELLSTTKEDDLVICLISGGGSALLFAPQKGISLGEVQHLNSLLLACGAKISEINAVRKHISAIKGGRLARMAYPAKLVGLILSDVIGDPLSVIASGPTTYDETTFADALGVIKSYGLEEKIPTVILNHLQRGAAGEIQETPKDGDEVLKRASNIIIGNNQEALYVARDKASQFGFNTLILSSRIEGEAREVAGVFAAICKEVATSKNPIAPPACILAGGETTVTLRGDGQGGRNQEFALAAAIEIEGFKNIVILSGGTDGTDGPTEAAGAIVDGQTLSNISKNPYEFLERSDSFGFFEDSPYHLLTGPTQTNVMDIIIGLIH